MKIDTLAENETKPTSIALAVRAETGQTIELRTGAMNFRSYWP